MAENQDSLAEALSPTYITDQLRALSPAFDKVSDLDMLRALHKSESPDAPFEDYVRKIGVPGFHEKSGLDTLVHGFGNSTTLGLADPILAAARAGAATPFDPGGISSALGQSQFAQWLHDKTGVDIGLRPNSGPAEPKDQNDPTIDLDRSGKTFQDLYEEQRRTQALENAQGLADHPVAHFGGDIAGLIAGLGPIKAATEALGAGRVLTNPLARASLDSALQGAGLGGVDAYHQGQDIGNGALKGGVLGGMAPSIGDAAVKGVNLAGAGVRVGGQLFQDLTAAAAALPREVLGLLADKMPNSLGAVRNLTSGADQFLGKLAPEGLKKTVGKVEGGSAGVLSEAMGLPGTDALFHGGLGLGVGYIPYIKAGIVKRLGEGVEDLTNPNSLGGAFGKFADSIGYDGAATGKAVTDGLIATDRSGAQDWLRHFQGRTEPNYSIPNQALTDPDGFIRNVEENYQNNPGVGQSLRTARDLGQREYRDAVFSMMNGGVGQHMFTPGMDGRRIGGQILGGLGALSGALGGGLIGGLPYAAEGGLGGELVGGKIGGYLGQSIQNAYDAYTSPKDTATDATEAVKSARDHPQEMVSALSKIHPQLASVLGNALKEGNMDKYNAMLFSASQNSEYREAIKQAHQAYNNQPQQNISAPLGG